MSARDTHDADADRGRTAEPTIFVSIAAYRDPQLVPTILDALAKAARPHCLRFGICWQHGPEESVLPFIGDPRFRILDIDWRDSGGCCWARAKTMELFDGEDWYLQLDAHHRFAQDWDATLLEQVARTGSQKPILSCQPPRFLPDDPDSFGHDPSQTTFTCFGPDGIPESLASSVIPDWRHRHVPVRGRFLAAGFLFAPGRFVTEVPYDPDLYFSGEEITMTIRAFTSGYDLFAPTQLVCWHAYVGPDVTRTRHEDDHVTANGVAIDWTERDRTSRQKVRRFLHEPFIGPFGCGTARTFAGYEAYAGLNFRQQCVSEYARQHLEPPNPPMRADWAARFSHYDVQITFDPTKLPADVTLLNVAFSDVREQEVSSQNGNVAEVRGVLAAAGRVAIIRRVFTSEREPFHWALSAHSKAVGWLRSFYGTIHASSRTVTWTGDRRPRDLGVDALRGNSAAWRPPALSGTASGTVAQPAEQAASNTQTEQRATV